MEDFNIVEALKYAPKGLKLYSPVLGEVEISEVSQGTYAIEVKISGKSYSFTEHGRYLEGKGECLLFPSKDHRTWDNWQSVLFPQSAGTVCVNTGTPKPTMFTCAPNGTIFDDNTGSTWDSLIDIGGNYLKTSRYATNEESKQFFDELKANGYEWDAEKKELRMLQPKKFDITTLKPFDKVLVRDSEDDIWTPDFYSFYSGDTNLLSRFNTITDAWKCCIPYNDDTKHLIGKNDDAPDFYKTWEYDK